MKKYIKSYTADELKAQLGDNYPKGGYLYILKHGIGPGTIPRDVTVVKTKDLPNYYTAVWLDRFLTADELREYDIPSETDINKYLGRINYCQKNGDVVPCDDVQACGQVTAAVKTHPKIPTGWNRVSEGDDENGNWTTISKELPNNDGYYWIDLYEDDNGKKYYEIQVGYRTADGSISDVSMLTSKQFYRLGDAVKFAEDKIVRDYDTDIDACGDITCATEPNAPDAKKSKLVREIIKRAKEIRDYFQSHNNNLNRRQEQILDDLSDGIDNQSISAIREAIENLKYNSKNMRSGQYDLIIDLYNDFNLAGGKYEGMGYPDADDDIEGCDNITGSTKSRYMATMVNASDDYVQLAEADEDDSTWEEPKYEAFSYYGTNYSGLEDNFVTDDTSDLMDWIWEHASKGGYIKVCGPKGCVKLDPDVLAENVDAGDIGEYEIMSQIDYL